MNRQRALAAVLVTAAVVAAGCGTDAAPEPAAEATAAPPDPGTGPSTTGTLAGTVTAGTVTAGSTSSSSSIVTSSAESDGQRPPRHAATIVTDAGTVHAAVVDTRLEVRLETTLGWTSQVERTDTSATIRLTGPAPSPTAETTTVSTVEVTIEATAQGISHRVASHAGGDHSTWRSAAETSVSSGDDDGP